LNPCAGWRSLTESAHGSSEVVDVSATAASPGDRWLEVFERALSDLPDLFADVDWGLQFDRAGLTVTAGDRLGGSSVTVALPPDHVEARLALGR
jgi:hypothetical protein